MTAKTTSYAWSTIFVTACLIGGNLVGAGILGLPINTGLAGLLPSFLTMVAGGALMYLSAVILGNHAAKHKDKDSFDYPSLYEKFLGKTGKWIAVCANMVILYGLLTAYFTGGTKILSALFGTGANDLIVFAPFAAFLIFLTCIKLNFLQKLNTLFIVCLVTAFVVLVFMGSEHIVFSRLRYADWRFLPATLPIIITAFHFHNIIPTVVTDLNYNMSIYRKSVFIGMLFAFVMNAVWIAVGIGAIPILGKHGLLHAFRTNLPATVPLGMQVKSSVFTFFASFFALIAICTSFLANGVGLLGFIKDLLSNSFKLNSRPLVFALTFLPPLLISYIYPDIFLTALNVVGGLGIVILFGILPVLITLIDRSTSRKMRTICVIALVFALFILAIEILQETGLLELKPWVEYHHNDLHEMRKLTCNH